MCLNKLLELFIGKGILEFVEFELVEQIGGVFFGEEGNCGDSFDRVMFFEGGWAEGLAAAFAREGLKERELVRGRWLEGEGDSVMLGKILFVGKSWKFSTRFQRFCVAVGFCV